jgi:hypothetical protein
MQTGPRVRAQLLHASGTGVVGVCGRPRLAGLAAARHRELRSARPAGRHAVAAAQRCRVWWRRQARDHLWRERWCGQRQQPPGGPPGWGWGHCLQRAVGGGLVGVVPACPLGHPVLPLAWGRSSCPRRYRHGPRACSTVQSWRVGPSPRLVQYEPQLGWWVGRGGAGSRRRRANCRPEPHALRLEKWWHLLVCESVVPVPPLQWTAETLDTAVVKVGAGLLVQTRVTCGEARFAH